MQELENRKVYTLEELMGEEGVAVAPPTKLTVVSGQKIRVTATIQYRGPALDDTFYAALGSRGFFGFDEWRHGQSAVHFNASTIWLPYTLTADIDTTGVANAVNLDLYCKLLEHPQAVDPATGKYPEVDDVIDIIGATPEFQNFKITDYSAI